MGYTVDFPKSALRDLAKLHSSFLDRVEPIILSLEATPRPDGVKKLQRFKDLYRIRVGPYRIVYHIDDSAHHITVLRIARRSHVYRSLI
jgi:mRNA interferase RelE/StbE